MNVTITKYDALDNVYSGFNTASGAVTSPIVFSTTTASTTAYITSITTAETKAGTPGWTAPGSVEFYSKVDANTYPVTISSNLSASGFTLSATGVDDAIGRQILTYTVVLSNSCLTQAGTATPTTATVDVSSRTWAFTTVISAINTAYQGFPSQAEFLRMQNLQG